MHIYNPEMLKQQSKSPLLFDLCVGDAEAQVLDKAGDFAEMTETKGGWQKINGLGKDDVVTDKAANVDIKDFAEYKKYAAKGGNKKQKR